MRKSKFLAVLLAAGVFMTFAMGSGSSGSSSSSSTAEKVGEVEDAQTSTETTEEKYENKSEIYVGDFFIDDDIKVTFVKSGEYIEEREYYSGPKDGYKFIYIDLYAENTGEKDGFISSGSFNCYADGYPVDSHSVDNNFYAKLSAGRTTSGIIVYEVPSDAKEIEIEFTINSWTDEKIKLIYEGEKDSGFVPEKNTEASADAFHVGDIVETDKLRIKYLSCGKFESDNEFIQPKDGFKYLYAEFEIENIGSTDKYISSYDFDCFADGSACDQSWYTGDDALDATISAGRKTKGKVVFEIPEEASTIEFEFLDNYWTSGRVKFLYE